MASILAYGFGLSSHMGSTFYKNVAKCWSESGQNQGIWSEPGPYGSVWGHILPEWILQGLGSLWDASRALKPLRKIQKSWFSGFKGNSPYFPLLPRFGPVTVAAAGRCRVAARQVTLVNFWCLQALLG